MVWLCGWVSSFLASPALVDRCGGGGGVFSPAAFPQRKGALRIRTAAAAAAGQGDDEEFLTLENAAAGLGPTIQQNYGVEPPAEVQGLLLEEDEDEEEEDEEGGTDWRDFLKVAPAYLNLNKEAGDMSEYDWDIFRRKRALEDGVHEQRRIRDFHCNTFLYLLYVTYDGKAHTSFDDSPFPDSIKGDLYEVLAKQMRLRNRRSGESLQHAAYTAPGVGAVENIFFFKTHKPIPTDQLMYDFNQYETGVKITRVRKILPFIRPEDLIVAREMFARPPTPGATDEEKAAIHSRCAEVSAIEDFADFSGSAALRAVTTKRNVTLSYTDPRRVTAVFSNGKKVRESSVGSWAAEEGLRIRVEGGDFLPQMAERVAGYVLTGEKGNRLPPGYMVLSNIVLDETKTDRVAFKLVAHPGPEDSRFITQTEMACDFRIVFCPPESYEKMTENGRELEHSMMEEFGKLVCRKDYDPGHSEPLYLAKRRREFKGMMSRAEREQQLLEEREKAATELLTKMGFATEEEVADEQMKEQERARQWRQVLPEDW
uniref:Uncharacterized protein n=1 Tax=Chromera velia CCMP2878 TaxID=1169474 RepID=A0A0G4G2H4_9ALVE|eukprot:Cvel_19911.t1-p1 / transcript=Cvel_19911.t1 / gene=Cvel_19911 / organism=Chromera_velia_CCMP2878 / gene_product=hypothetical protein / transcript_product=hypothetical protein / location=Cvel_scaffold1750:30466-35187(+) / protein_length=539 / sequence_SO=supercontig / SO=protein_coding / is_pseudo=false